MTTKFKIRMIRSSHLSSTYKRDDVGNEVAAATTEIPSEEKYLTIDAEYASEAYASAIRREFSNGFTPISYEIIGKDNQEV